MTTGQFSCTFIVLMFFIAYIFSPASAQVSLTYTNGNCVCQHTPRVTPSPEITPFLSLTPSHEETPFPEISPAPGVSFAFTVSPPASQAPTASATATASVSPTISTTPSFMFTPPTLATGGSFPTPTGTALPTPSVTSSESASPSPSWTGIPSIIDNFLIPTGTPSPTAYGTGKPNCSPSPPAVRTPCPIPNYVFKYKVVYIHKRRCELVCDGSPCRYCRRFKTARRSYVRVCRRAYYEFKCHYVQKMVWFGYCFSHQQSVKIDSGYKRRAFHGHGKRGNNHAKTAW